MERLAHRILAFSWIALTLLAVHLGAHAVLHLPVARGTLYALMLLILAPICLEAAWWHWRRSRTPLSEMARQRQE